MILKMKKAVVICLKADRDALLKALQRFGRFMPVGEGEDARFAAAMAEVQKTQRLFADTAEYRGKRGLFMPRPAAPVSALLGEDAEAAQLRETLAQKLRALKEDGKNADAARDELDGLAPWRAFAAPAEDLLPTDYTRSFCGFIPDAMAGDAENALSAAGAAFVLGLSGKRRAVVAVCAQADAAAMDTALMRLDFSPEPFPVSAGTAEAAYQRAQKRYYELETKIEAQKDGLRRSLGESNALERLLERTLARADRLSVDVSETLETASIMGWVPEEDVPGLKRAVASVSEATEVLLADPQADEVPPTCTRNNPFIAQFETITDMFSRPAYGTIDPNPIMGVWYWIIFGMMMADVGYGCVVMALTLALKAALRPRGGMKKLINIILFSSVTTILFGVLFGSYFGQTWHPLLFSPMDDPMKMLVISMGVGVLHIFSGMGIKAAESIRAGRWYDAVFDQFSWMLLIAGGVMLFLPATRTPGMALAITGAAIVLLTAGRAGKGIFGKIAGGLGGLYGATGYLSDILSYSRILALGMATAVIGMVMNLLASMVQHGVIGFALSILIYAVGHAFNLAMGLLSAYVHDSRLQYIEFFGKFYDGGGTAFAPLAVRQQYVDATRGD